MRILLVLALWVWFSNRPPMADIGGTPFAKLTLDMLSGNFYTLLIAISGLWALAWSLMKDKFWPWRWEWGGWKDGLKRIIYAFIGFSFFIWVPRLIQNPDDAWLMYSIMLSGPGVAIWVLSADRMALKRAGLPFYEDEVP